MATTAMPLRTDFPLTTDPFKYRLMELVGVYGDALRERCNELFGDGILSAIDCVVKLEKKGERGVLTIDAKVLHYKESCCDRGRRVSNPSRVLLQWAAAMKRRSAKRPSPSLGA